MSHILCKWLNEEVVLSKKTQANKLDQDFQSGFLFAELLFNYRLIDSLEGFHKVENVDFYIKNYILLEPALKAIGVSMNSNSAYELITAKQGSAAKLLYQIKANLFQNNLLDKNQNVNAIVKKAQTQFRLKEHEFFADRLKSRFKRVDLGQKNIQSSAKSSTQQQTIRSKSTALPKIQPLSKSKPSKTQKKVVLKKEKEEKANPVVDEDVQNIIQLKSEIRKNEKKEQNLREIAQEIQNLNHDVQIKDTPKELPILALVEPKHKDETKQLLEKLKAKRKEDEILRKERETQRLKLLLEQQTIQTKLEIEKSDKELLDLLNKKSKQEQRIAEQLLDTKKEKEKIIKNRIYRDSQYAEQRQKEYEEAIRKESEIGQSLREEYKTQVETLKTQYEEIKEKHVEGKKRKHYKFCKSIVEQLVEISLQASDTKSVYEGTIPPQKMVDWKRLFLANITAENRYDLSTSEERIQDHFSFVQEEKSNSLTHITPQKEEIYKGVDVLDDGDFNDYLNLTGNWVTNEKENFMQNEYIAKLIDLVFEATKVPEKTNTLQKLSAAPIKLALLGKPFTGKRGLAQKIAEVCQIKVIECEALMNDLHKNHSTDSDSDVIKNFHAQGKKVEAILSKGEQIDDETLVSLVSSYIKTLGSAGWILVDFPRTKAQAALLEKELSGYEEPKVLKPGNLKKQSVKETPGSKKKSNILPNNEKVENNAAVPISALDMILYLNSTNETVMKRVVGRRFDPLTGRVYHLDADLSNTIPGLADRLILLEEDPTSHSRVQLQSHLLAYEEQEPEMKEWFQKFETLQNIDANEAPEKVEEMVEAILEKLIQHKKNAGIKEEQKEGDKAIVENSAKTNDLNSNPSPTEQTTSASTVLKATLPSAIKKPNNDLAKLLNEKWVSVEGTYTDAIKFCLRSFRREKETFANYFHISKVNFENFLRKPDGKKNLIKEFVSLYNSLEEDFMYFLFTYFSADPEVKSEIHLRTDELKERIWAILDVARDEAEAERNNLISQRWVEEQLINLFNIFISMIQLEVDRFIGTKQFLIDYSRDTSDLPLEETLSTSIQLPKYELNRPDGLFEDLIKAKKEIPVPQKKTRRSSTVSGKSVKLALTKKADEQTQQEKQNEDEISGDTFPILSVFLSSIETAMTFILEDSDTKDNKKKSVEASAEKQSLYPIMQEAVNAIKKESLNTKLRIERIKSLALKSFLQYKSQAHEMYVKMDESIAQRYQREMEAVKDLVFYLRDKVENEAKLEESLVLATGIN